MSSITLINNLSGPVPTVAAFCLLQTNGQLDRVEVNPDSQVSWETSPKYTIRAEYMGRTARPLSDLLTVEGSTDVLARWNPAISRLALETAPGTNPRAIMLTNVTTERVRFTVTPVGSSSKNVVDVEAMRKGLSPIERRWSAYAMINGILTPMVSFEDPEAVLLLAGDPSTDNYTLTLSSARTPAQAAAPQYMPMASGDRAGLRLRP